MPNLGLYQYIGEMQNEAVPNLGVVSTHGGDADNNAYSANCIKT